MPPAAPAAPAAAGDDDEDDEDDERYGKIEENALGKNERAVHANPFIKGNPNTSRRRG